MQLSARPFFMDKKVIDGPSDFRFGEHAFPSHKLTGAKTPVESHRLQGEVKWGLFPGAPADCDAAYKRPVHQGYLWCPARSHSTINFPRPSPSSFFVAVLSLVGQSERDKDWRRERGGEKKWNLVLYNKYIRDQIRFRSETKAAQTERERGFSVVRFLFRVARGADSDRDKQLCVYNLLKYEVHDGLMRCRGTKRSGSCPVHT